MCLNVRTRRPVYKNESLKASSPHEGEHLYTSVHPLANIISRLRPREGTEHIQLSTLLFFPSVYQIHIFLPPSLSLLHTLFSLISSAHFRWALPPTRRGSANQVLGVQPATRIYTARRQHRFTLLYPCASSVSHCSSPLSLWDRWRTVTVGGAGEDNKLTWHPYRRALCSWYQLSTRTVSKCFLLWLRFSCRCVLCQLWVI